MAEIYTYAHTAFGSGEYNRQALITECTAALGQAPFQFVNDGSNVALWFQTAVTVATLDGVVAAHQGLFERAWINVVSDPVIEPVLPGSSKVLANDRPAIEVQDAVTGFGAIGVVWPVVPHANHVLRLRVKFILKATGTGSNVRIAARYKADVAGGDSSGAFAQTAFVAVPVTFTTIGEVFEAELRLPAATVALGAALALQVGRDGNNELGAGANDDVNQAVQIIALEAEAG